MTSRICPIISGILLFWTLVPVTVHAEFPALRGLEDPDRHFEEIEIGDSLVVYYHQRMIDSAIVERDFIVYQFNRHSGKLLSKNVYWRDDLPDALPPGLIPREKALSRVEGEVVWARLYFISPESAVFPIDPPPQNPCWVVKSLVQGLATVAVVDALEGTFLGYGVPPPYSGVAMTGPFGWLPCSGGWPELYQNARQWIESMGYPTEGLWWPDKEQLREHIQSNTTALFYEVGHSPDAFRFAHGCAYDGSLLYTHALQIESWLEDYPKMPFAFFYSCGGMCESGPGTLSDVFRKGSVENTTTVGFCSHNEEYCPLCYVHELDWQNAFFHFASLGYAVKGAFDMAQAAYPMCAAGSCFAFAGDPDFAIVPPVPRTGVKYLVEPGGTGDFPTIQAAVDAAAPGDWIELADGVFSGEGNREVAILGKNIVLRSGSGDPESCVIDCGGLGRGFYVESGLDQSTVLQGFTIRNARASSSCGDADGGGVCCRGSRLLVVECRFMENEAEGNGGGLSCDSSWVTIRSSVFSENACEGVGAGVYVGNGCEVGIFGSTLRGNAATVAGGGIGISSLLTFEDNVVHGNWSGQSGGGMYYGPGSGAAPVISHCTVAGNFSQSTGGGLQYDGDTSLRLDYVILWGNEAAGSGEEICTSGGASVDVTCSCMDSSGASVEGSVYFLWHDAFADPGFCEFVHGSEAPTTDGDFHLKDASPCAPENSDCGLKGALGVTCTSNLWAVSPDGSGDFATIQDALDGAPSYDIVELSEGVYTGAGNRDLDFRGRGLTLRSQSGKADLCVIDCEGQGRGFSFHSGEGARTLLENLTITGGLSAEGGALHCDRASPTISGCVLHHNQASTAGGAVCLRNASPVFDDCTLVGNLAATGSAIDCELSSPTVRNMIIAFGEIGAAISCDASSSPVLTCCDLYGNAGGDWVGCIAAEDSIDGNLCADPGFHDPAGQDYHLLASSPCLDAPGCGRIGALGRAFTGNRAWRVPGDVPTIQAAIDSAWAGDSVLVAPGTYYEHDISMKSGVYLGSESGRPDEVTIDAGQQGRVLACVGVDSTATVERLTLMGGLASGLWPNNAGGGIFCDNSTVKIRGVVIHSNSATYGGAVAARASSPQITGCTCAYNAATGQGGGIYGYYSTVVLENTIVAFSSQGQAVCCGYLGSAVPVCCDLFGNAGGDWVSCVAGKQGVDGNFSADPEFCIPFTGHVASTSSCAPGNSPPECGQVGALGAGCTTTDVADAASLIPRRLDLGPAVPNPFNPITEISYGIPAGGEDRRVRILVYDAVGRKVKTLVDSDLAPGFYRVVWDGRDHRGVPVGSGIYFCRLTWGRESQTQKMVLLK